MSYHYVKHSKSGRKKIVKLFGFALVLGGLLFFLYFFFPVISYQLFIAGQFENSEIETPVPKRLVVNNNASFTSLIAQGMTSLTSDYTDARNWYPELPSRVEASGSQNGSQAEKKVDTYTLSIPRINIENAEVSTVDYDLENHLIQYLGTSIPGEKGTAVIFGHSTLPYLFDPNNYKTIFANAHQLEVGDELFVTVEGVTYKYEIFSVLITDPEDTNILSQSYDHSYITLVTCTPPGTIWKRLVLRASLESAIN